MTLGHVPFVDSPDSFRAIAETPCTSEYLSASETIGSDRHLRFLSVMITRLLLSLRKANASPEPGWSLRELTTHTTIRFAEHLGGVVTRDETRTDAFASTHEGTQSQA